jgi:hypothetical protein
MPGFNSMTLMVSDLKKCTFISAAGKSRIAVRDASFDFICVRGFGKTGGADIRYIHPFNFRRAL